ncbi:hypothetical protein KKD80_00125 [Patescibacteria group bacterium]|nr:hypothetical protein [Patescibacteria group bacterium]
MAKSKTSRKHEAPVSFYRKIAFVFVALTSVLIIFAAYFVLSRTDITVTIAKEPVSTDFIADLKEVAVQNPAEPSVAVPGAATISGKVTEATVSGSKEYPTTGKKTAEGEVGGTVTIFNNYSKDQPLVATTRLLSSEGILYRLKDRVNVPAGSKVENVEVYADTPSEAAAKLGPTKFTIPGLWEGLQDKIYAQSFSAMHGGEQEISFVTQTDLDNAYSDLTKTLSEKVLDDLKKEMPSAGEIFGKVVIKEISEKRSDLKAGATGDKFTVNLAMKVVGISFYKRDVESLAWRELGAKVPADKELTSVDYEGMTFLVEKYDVKNGEANIMVHLSGEMALKSDSSIFDKDKFIGLSKEKIIQYLSLYPEIERITIKFSPFWVKKVPQIKTNINIIVK